MLWVLLLACDKGDDTNGTPSDDSTPVDDSSDDSGTEKPPVLTGACENGTRVGYVEISHTSHDDALVYAEVNDSVLPTSELTLIEEKNGCKMMRKENPFCDPTCESGYTCNLDGKCVPYPERIDVGTIEITGTTAPYTMKPAGSKLPYYWYGDAELPMFEPGDPVKATIEGSTRLAGFELHGYGVEQVELPDGQEWDPKDPKLRYTWTLQADTPFEFTWIPSKEEEGDMYVTLAIDQHGQTPATLFCEVDDSGSLTVPASMINELISRGVSGFPAAYVYRRTMDHVETELGCVEMEVSVQHEPFLTVVGHTPCATNDDCPDGQSCDLPTQTCVDKK
jgi:hypothetical protein